MFRLTAELLLYASVGLLACLYVRDRVRGLRSQCIEWLRQQRIVTATQIAGPMATQKRSSPASDPLAKAQTEPPPNPVVTPVPSILPTLDYELLDVPTFVRHGTAPVLLSNSAPPAQDPLSPTKGDEELLGYVYP